MMFNMNLKFMVFILLTQLISAPPVYAKDDAIVRAQYMIRQINAELNQLKSVNLKLKSDQSEAEIKYKALDKKYKKLVNNSRKNTKNLSGAIKAVKKKYVDEVAFHKETRNKLRDEVGKNKRLEYVVNQKTEKINLCISNNNKLYDVNKRILKSYENKGVWDSFSQAEPFSQLTKVEVENMVDDTLYEINDLLVN